MRYENKLFLVLPFARSLGFSSGPDLLSLGTCRCGARAISVGRAVGDLQPTTRRSPQQGDEDIVKHAWPMMIGWMADLDEVAVKGLIKEFHGDWRPPTDISGQRAPVELTSTALYGGRPIEDSR